MSTKTEALKQLRETLASLYTKQADIFRIAEDTGLDRARIKEDTAINMWRDILSEADKHHGIESIIAVATKEYPTIIEPTKQAYMDYLKATNTVSESQVQSKIQVHQPPSVDLDLYQSIQFKPFEISPRLDSISLDSVVPLEHIYDNWIDAHNSKTTLIFTLDFPLDVQQTLTAISTRFSISQWIDSETFLNPKVFNSPPSANSTINLADLAPSCLFLDFSEVEPDYVFSGSFVSGYQEFTDKVSTFCELANYYNHRVVLGLPRFIQALVNIKEINHKKTLIYTSADLFLTQYQHRVEQCQKYISKADTPGIISQGILNDYIKRDKILCSLLRANSNALPLCIAHFFLKLPSVTDLDFEKNGSLGLPVFLKLSEKLTELGFYEIAYRLELYCRTLERWQNLDFVSLDGDLDFEPQNQNTSEKILGLIEGLEKIPAMVSRGILSGESGAGKTSVLRQIEHRWSLPEPTTKGIRIQYWIPLKLTVDKELNLWYQMQKSFDENKSMKLGLRRESYRLACHDFLAKVATQLNFQYLLCSPIYLMIDGIDELPVELHSELSRKVKTLTESISIDGMLIASRIAKLSDFADLPQIRIRSMVIKQVEQFLQNRGDNRELQNLFGRINKPVAQYLRNPYLLSIICDTSSSSIHDIENSNLCTLIQAYIDQTVKGLKDPKAYPITEEWLPQLALQMKVENITVFNSEDDKNNSYILYARQMDLLRNYDDDGLVQFQHQYLLDYFAAKQLSKELKEHGILTIIEQYLPNSGAVNYWSILLKVLSGLLSSDKEFEQLLEYVRNYADLQLANECLLEVYFERRRDMNDEIAKQLDQTVKNICEINSLDKIKNIEALSFLDPRIHLDDPKKGMIEVQLANGETQFRIGKYPVTNMEYSQFVEAKGYDNSTLWDESVWKWLRDNNIKHPQYWNNAQLNKPNYPVVGISFFEAYTYCYWLSKENPGYVFSLPSVVQWDTVAYKGESDIDRVLYFLRQLSQNETDLNELLQQFDEEQFDLNYSDTKPQMLSAQLVSYINEYMTSHRQQLEFGVLTPVGTFKPNEQGCFDLFGNVWEWCGTWLSDYEDEKIESLGLQIKPGDSVVVKGGPWAGGMFNPVWTAMDGWFDPYVRYHELSFRICCTKQNL